MDILCSIWLHGRILEVHMLLTCHQFFFFLCWFFFFLSSQPFQNVKALNSWAILKQMVDHRITFKWLIFNLSLYVSKFQLQCLYHCHLLFSHSVIALQGFPGGSDGKVSACNAGDPALISGSGRSPGEGNGNPLQHSCLENPMDGGAW